MANNESGYPLKSPRGRTHDLATRSFDYVEDAIYMVVAILLVVAGIFVLGNAIVTIAHDVGLPPDAKTQETWPTKLVIDVLDNGLLLFIVAELLHTVRATIQERTLVVEPFLIVGLIAGVRRLLVLTAQLAATNATFTWANQGIEIVVLLGLILGMTVALVLYHRSHGAASREDEG